MNENNKETNKSIFSQMEEEVLDFWQKNKIFEKSVKKEAPNGNYVFYDGPPFITGLPHYATLLPSIVKDLIPRYWTMKGYRVERVWGWDCHGLPAENKVEQNLGLKNKKDIESLGVGKFVDACRDYVKTGSEQWRWYIDRIGRWVDMDTAYKTMDINFMESVIWAFKNLYDKGLIYEGYRTSLHCPRCATPLSKFEITMDSGSYKDISDDAVVVEFKSDEGLYFLAWTTTPWTLPGNLALAIGNEIDYAIIENLGKEYVLAKDKVNYFFEGKEHKIKKIIKGSDLVGIKYEPIFDLENLEIKENNKTFKIYHADFIKTDEGTGIVHIAPNFGEDDFELGKNIGLPVIELMDENGIYTDNAGNWSGYYFEKANKKSLEELKDKIFLKNKYTHSYPFCYRCNTKLIHKTQKAWYLKINKIRQSIIESNNEINWIPEYFKEGRFKYNLENAPDWCVSRSRYWGSPIPVWKCLSCFQLKVVGSIDEIEKLSGFKIEDLHRPGIDMIEFNCECGHKMKRVPEVLDVWFESGSMPFAQFHYPFERKNDWKNIFPADFIIEYTGQLRGWFYYLHVLSNSLFDSMAFRNVIVTGVLAGTDGRKMSKSFGNYPDPKGTLDKYGSDALRIYFMSSPIMLGGDMNFSEQDLQDSLRKNIILLWNIVNFYDLFASSHDFKLINNSKEPDSNNILDKWILSSLNSLINEVTNNLEKYNLPLACQSITRFINDFSTWYIRRSRDRFKGDDYQKALEVTGYTLLQLSKLIAPVMPFIAEQIWQKITDNKFQDSNKSVHLEKWINGNSVDENILLEMANVRKIVELGLAVRDEQKIKVRQPLSKMEIKNCILKEEFIDLLKDELNIKNIEIFPGEGELSVDFDFNITENLKIEGMKREMIRFVNNIRKNKGLGIEDKIILYYNTQSDDLKKIFSNKELKNDLMKNILANDIVENNFEKIKEKKEININGQIIFLEIEIV